MARQSRTPMVILGLLCIEPMSGYDLKATIDRSISQFWNESYGQLYPALKKLTDDGMVSKDETRTGGRQRNVYTITDSGRQHLRAWLTEPAARRYVRNELLLKLFFSLETVPAVVRGHLQRERAVAEGTVAGINAAIAELKATSADAPELPYWLMTLDLGRRTALAQAEWAKHSLQLMDDSETTRS